MGKINLYNSLDNSYQVINGCGKLADLLPTVDFNNSVILKAGNRLNKDYEVLPEDVLFVRKIPAVATTLGMVLTGVAVTVIGGMFLGAILYNIIDGKQRAQQEKAQRDAQNLASQINQLPFIKGAQNKSALGYAVPYVIGDVYHTPYKMTDGYYSIENGTGATDYGAKQYYNVVLNLGYGNQKIKEILIGDNSLLKSNNGISEGVHNVDSSSIFYDPDNKIEVCQANTQFTQSFFGKKVICTQDGTEIKHEHSEAAEPVIRTLADYTKTVEVCIQFNGLRKYDSDNSKWIKLKNKIVPYWTNKDNPSDSDWNEFAFDNMQNNEIELNTNHTVRFVARKTFSAAEAYGKTIKIKLVKVTPAEESNSNESCYLVYYQSFCYDNKKSSASSLVDCNTIEDALTAKTTRIGLRLIANENTKDELNEIHALVSGLARTWNGTTWSTDKTATRNPAAWILEIMTSDAHKHSKYADNEIDLDSFGAFYTHCADNDLFSDGILTEGVKKEDLLSDLLNICNASMFINSSGKWEIRIDEKEDTPVALLNAESISDINYTKDMTRIPDGLKVTFTNRDSWQVDTFYIKADGTARKQDDTFAEFNLSYVTTYEHAYKLALMHLKQMRLQPREIIVDVGRDGDYYPLYSTVMLQYTTFRQGLNSSVIAGLYKDDDNNIIGVKLSDKIEMEAGNNYGLIIQVVSDSGKNIYYKPVQTTAGNSHDLIFTSEIDADDDNLPGIGDIVSFGLLDDDAEFTKVTNVMKITGIASNGANGYKLTLKDYNPNIYEAGTVPAYKSNITRPPKPAKEIPVYERLEGEPGQNGKSAFSYRGIIKSLAEVPDDVNVDDFFMIGQNFTEQAAISTSDGALISVGTNKVLGYVYKYVKGSLYSYQDDGRLHLISNKNDYRYTVAQNDRILLGGDISPALESVTVDRVYEETGLDKLETPEITETNASTGKVTIKADLIDADAIKGKAGFFDNITIEKNATVKGQLDTGGIKTGISSESIDLLTINTVSGDQDTIRKNIESLTQLICRYSNYYTSIIGNFSFELELTNLYEGFGIFYGSVKASKIAVSHYSSRAGDSYTITLFNGDVELVKYGYTIAGLSEAVYYYGDQNIVFKYKYQDEPVTRIKTPKYNFFNENILMSQNGLLQIGDRNGVIKLHYAKGTAIQKIYYELINYIKINSKISCLGNYGDSSTSQNNSVSYINFSNGSSSGWHGYEIISGDITLHNCIGSSLITISDSSNTTLAGDLNLLFISNLNDNSN